MGKSAEAVKEFIESIANPLGYEVLEVAYSKKYGDLNLTIYIGKEPAITLDDGEVRNAIDAVQDETDAIPEKKVCIGCGGAITLEDGEVRNATDAVPGKKVYVGRGGAITLEDCEKVHNAIDAPLDEFDPTGGAPYILNVSSYGIDRPLKTERDYRRAAGTEVEVAVYNSVGGKKRLVGILKSYDENAVTIVPEGEKQIIIGKKNISKIKPYIRFE
jgi:ribosome maturation factor RimP